VNTGNEPHRPGERLAPLVPVDAVVWHDLEHGSESADLSLWGELAQRVPGDGLVLELGCGTGRVALHLARRGHEVIGIDTDPALVGAFNERAAQENLPAQAVVGDVRTLTLRRAFALVIAPMQLIELLGDATERLSALHAAADHLGSGGRAAFAIVEPDSLGAAAAERWAGPEALPDVREIHDWVFSSRPMTVKPGARGVVVKRFRQRVSPRGEIFEEEHSEVLDLVGADRLEEEARLAQLVPIARRTVAASYGYAPSTVIVVEKR
jgi:SAM-dependent methyltransferase